MMRRPLPLAVCIALVTSLSFSAAAQESTQPAQPEAQAAAGSPAGDAERGRQLTYTCQGCHGLTGYKNAYPSFKVPKIGGQSAEYLSQALHEYRDNKRRHPTMRAQAQSFSEQDIADIAAFLSTLK
ncbi:cytochrome c [Pseudoxanthomonas sp. SGNA-20]|jgi:Cytochrome c553|uniref:c-type cytochrome n=1 Tax=unclassified Pseudoxanthomonas TaxID=2645906 RepID=UPI0003F7023B|nr:MULTISPECIES: cytochrome c [unclassified Pseudoxanthomonas]RRN54756.1 cytochrome c [Pseudoxanthomonas sp. SGNA-20]